MTKKKNEIPTHIANSNILVYDDENIMYYHGKIVSFCNEAIVNKGRFINGENYTNIIGNSVCFNTSCIEESESIKLDDTTMKRIAKFNKNQEIKRLDKKIQEKQNKIKELDSLLQDKEKRWNKVKDYIKNIYDISLDDDYDDYDDDWD